MIDNVRALELIEQAERETPFCRCGEQTVPVGRTGGVWLECFALQAPSHGLARLLRMTGPNLGHVQRLIVDLSPAAAA